MIMIMIMIMLMLGACDPWQVDEWLAQSESLARPEIYRAWWRDAERCSGLAGDFDRVTWRVFVSEETRSRWLPPHMIILTPAHVDAAGIVRHEMLHDLTQSGSHRARAWCACYDANLALLADPDAAWCGR